MEFIQYRKVTQLSTIFLLTLFLANFVIPEYQAYAAVAFNVNSASLSSSSIISNSTSIVANGTKIYAVWRDGPHVGFSSGTYSGGSTFNPSARDIGDISNTSPNPQIGVGGNNVYIAWQNTTDIRFIGTSNPSSLAAPTTSVKLGTTTFTSTDNPIAVTNSSGNNVVVAWRSSTTVYSFAQSSDGGSTFSNSGTIGVTVSSAHIQAIKLAATSTNVYAAYVHMTASTLGTIFVSKSTDSGASFNSPGTQLSGSVNGGASVFADPNIAASGSNVYVIWKDGSNPPQIILSRSTDSGSTFTNTILDTDAGVGIQSYPKVAVGSGNNVYAVWQDQTTGDIKLRQSTDAGATWGAEQNLSNTSNTSTAPVLKTSQSNVNVAWQEQQPSTNNVDVYLRVSTDDGAHFSGINKLDTTSDYNINIALAASSDKMYAAWEEHSTTTTSDGTIKFTSAQQSPVKVYFLDSSTSTFRSQYKTGDQAKIVVTDTSKTGAGSISVTVSSSQSGSSITPTLSESPANSGNFTGNISFTSGSSSGSTLKITPGSNGDFIKAQYNDGTNNFNSLATIFPITISFVNIKSGSTITSYALNNLEKVKVTDTSSVGLGSITVKITSNADSTGVSLVLTERPASSGTFEKDTIIAMPGDYRFNISDTATISQTETDGSKVNAGNPRTITTVKVNSTSDSTGFNPTLSETSTNTFTGTLSFTTAVTGNNALHVAGGDILSINYLQTGLAGDGLVSNGLILPNSNSSVGAIQVTTTSSSCSSCVTATFNGVSSSASISPSSEPGGGSGGIVRPGLVLNVIASLSKGGSSVSPSFSLDSLAITQGSMPENIRQQVLNQDPTKPLLAQHDQFDYPVIIDGGGYVIGRYENKISTVTENTNTPVDLKLNIPATNLQHLAMYVNLHGKENDLGKSDTYIIYEKGSQLTIVDPHHYFDHVKFDLTTEGVKNKIDYTITFANPMEKSNIVLRTWNDRHASSDVVLLDALQVVDSKKLTSPDELSPVQQQQIPIPQTTAESQPESKVPSWVKNNVKLWNAGSIEDKEFKTGIQYLISEKIISIPKQAVEPTESSTIPKWVKNTAGFWANGDVSEDEFLHGIEYLVKMGIITP